VIREGAPKPTRAHAWQVLSAALSWAAASTLVPEIQTNGCGLASEPRVNRRRSMRVGGTGYAPSTRRHGLAVASWALSPRAVEAIRQTMLTRVRRRSAILAHRDAMIVSLQYGLAARNQEVWALRWMSIEQDFMWVREVLSHGLLDEWGKTEDSVQRRTLMPRLLLEDLTEWHAALSALGHPARPIDFIIPGDLAGKQHGSREHHTDACHLTATKRKRGAANSSRQRSGRQQHSPSSCTSPVPRPTRCDAAASRCGCALRTPRPSPASAARAYRCSAATTPMPSRTYAATDRAPSTPSGAKRAPLCTMLTPSPNRQ
jgi:hypothetical protein